MSWLSWWRLDNSCLYCYIYAAVVTTLFLCLVAFVIYVNFTKTRRKRGKPSVTATSACE